MQGYNYVWLIHVTHINVRRVGDSEGLHPNTSCTRAAADTSSPLVSCSTFSSPILHVSSPRVFSPIFSHHLLHGGGQGGVGGVGLESER